MSRGRAVRRATVARAAAHPARPQFAIHDHHNAMTDDERAAAKRLADRQIRLHHAHRDQSALDRRRAKTARAIDDMWRDNEAHIARHDASRSHWRL